jgi:hypothetical protein
MFLRFQRFLREFWAYEENYSENVNFLSENSPKM